MAWLSTEQRYGQARPGGGESATASCVQLHNARSLNDLRAPPGNCLEALSGKRRGQHSIRINDQWRVCFVWDGGDAFNVEIVDYHS